MFFPALGTILVLVAAFVCKKKQKMQKIEKGYLLQTQPYPWWTLYLEPPFCIRFGRFHQDEIRDRMKKRHPMRCVFMPFDVCKYNSTEEAKNRKNIRMIPPPNAAIPLVNPILRTSILCQIWDSPLDYLIEMRPLVSIQNSIFRSIEQLFFSSCWHDLGFGGSLFLFLFSTLKKYYKFDFCSFWHNLGFSGSFFPLKIHF